MKHWAHLVAEGKNEVLGCWGDHDVTCVDQWGNDFPIDLCKPGLFLNTGLWERSLQILVNFAAFKSTSYIEFSRDVIPLSSAWYLGYLYCRLGIWCSGSSHPANIACSQPCMCYARRISYPLQFMDDQGRFSNIRWTLTVQHTPAVNRSSVLSVHCYFLPGHCLFKNLFLTNRRWAAQFYLW